MARIAYSASSSSSTAQFIGIFGRCRLCTEEVTVVAANGLGGSRAKLFGARGGDGGAEDMALKAKSALAERA